MKPKITHHAKMRAYQRKIDASNINHIYKYGHKIAEYNEPLYSYLLTKQLDGDHTSILIYGNNIYVFDNRNKALLTVYPVPVEYLPTKHFLGVEYCPCVIYFEGEPISEGNSTEPIIFRTKQNAYNYVKNCGWLDFDSVEIVDIGGSNVEKGRDNFGGI